VLSSIASVRALIASAQRLHAESAALSPIWNGSS
jgi:hypothetical protein